MTFEIDPRAVRGVVFDLGGVFLAGGVENVSAFGMAHGLSPQAWLAIRRDLFIAEGHPWGRVERGEMSLEAFAGEMVGRFAAHGVGLPRDRARHFMGAPGSAGSRLRPEIVDACLAVRAHLPTALLTNNIAEWRDGWRGLLDTARLFDLVVDSSEVGIRKPEEGIYRIVERGLALPGAALLLIDDQGLNLKGARRLGWQTLKYDDTARVLAALREVVHAAVQRSPGPPSPGDGRARPADALRK
ncbi:MAG: HAD-IA family hydrolase [Candidatus Lambdaproteobacteria bacterium]|nr:HAD-IA family hydrolase [Candidatus Lambdaproteobacteria bacterium]